MPEEETQTISSPIVKRFDDLANAPGSAQERKRRREKLLDNEALKSASKNQAVMESSFNTSISQAYPGMSPSPYESTSYLQRNYVVTPPWGSTLQPSIGGGAQLPRSALSSPQLSQLFASPERARKLSDTEKRYSCFSILVLPYVLRFSASRMKCKRWIAHAVLSRVEDTINQYSRTKMELEHLKKHKVMGNE
jgi:hypothetical protein